MRGFALKCGRAVAASVVLAATLGACSSPSTRPSPNTTPEPLPARSAGGKIFDKWCSDCHSPATGPGSLALARKYRGTLPAVLEQRSDLPPEYVTVAVRHGVSFMPSFRKTEISDADLALLAAYLAPTPGRTP